MGHITVVGQSIGTVREKIRAIIGNDVPASWTLANISTKNLHGSHGEDPDTRFFLFSSIFYT
jgi:hypothetical protein